MKHSVLIFGFSILLISSSSCGNSTQGDAQNLATKIQNTVKENTPGSLPVTEGGYTMTAKINGKEWKASSMMPPSTGRIIGYYNKDYISFPYGKRDMIAGKKIRISENWAVDFVTEKDGICSGKSGEMVITKVDSNWVEGTFFFTVNSCLGAETKIAVTDGFFRIPTEH